jgi:hypothetical protein
MWSEIARAVPDYTKGYRTNLMQAAFLSYGIYFALVYCWDIFFLPLTGCIFGG